MPVRLPVYTWLILEEPRNIWAIFRIRSRPSRCRDDRSSKSLAITANGLRYRCIMNTHNVRGNRRANRAQHEHHTHIMMEQKEHTRVRRARKCRACVTNTRATTQIQRRWCTDVRCYYLASPHRSAKILAVRCGIVGHKKVLHVTSAICKNDLASQAWECVFEGRCVSFFSHNK